MLIANLAELNAVYILDVTVEILRTVVVCAVSRSQLVGEKHTTQHTERVFAQIHKISKEI